MITIDGGTGTILHNGVKFNKESDKEMDCWRLSDNTTAAGGYGNYITSNWERDDFNFSKQGTGLTESSGVFTFPSTGLWLLTVVYQFTHNATPTYCGGYIHVSSNSGSSFDRVSEGFDNIHEGGGYCNLTQRKVIDVTNASTFRFKLETEVQGDTAILRGSSTQNRTHLTCVRLGDT